MTAAHAQATEALGCDDGDHDDDNIHVDDDDDDSDDDDDEVQLKSVWPHSTPMYRMTVRWQLPLLSLVQCKTPSPALLAIDCSAPVLANEECVCVSWSGWAQKLAPLPHRN